MPVYEQACALNQKLQCHYSYYEVTGNLRALRLLCEGTKRIWHKWLGRRSNRPLYWDQMAAILNMRHGADSQLVEVRNGARWEVTRRRRARRRYRFLDRMRFRTQPWLIVTVGLVRFEVCLGLAVCLMACGGSSSHATGGVTLGGFPVAGQKRTESASVHDELTRGVQQPDCDRTIEVFDASSLPKLNYSVIASTSVRCDYRALAYCKRQLVERACDLGGDAVIVEAAEAKPVPAGTMTRKDVTESGQVLRYTKQ